MSSSSKVIIWVIVVLVIIVGGVVYFTQSSNQAMYPINSPYATSTDDSTDLGGIPERNDTDSTAPATDTTQIDSGVEVSQ